MSERSTVLFIFRYWHQPMQNSQNLESTVSMASGNATSKNMIMTARASATQTRKLVYAFGTWGITVASYLSQTGIDQREGELTRKHCSDSIHIDLGQKRRSSSSQKVRIWGQNPANLSLDRLSCRKISTRVVQTSTNDHVLTKGIFVSNSFRFWSCSTEIWYMH